MTEYSKGIEELVEVMVDDCTTNAELLVAFTAVIGMSTLLLAGVYLSVHAPAEK
jgi:hypothetical protein